MRMVARLRGDCQGLTLRCTALQTPDGQPEDSAGGVGVPGCTGDGTERGSEGGEAGQGVVSVLWGRFGVTLSTLAKEPAEELFGLGLALLGYSD
jgi:hypothetical protein